MTYKIDYVQANAGNISNLTGFLNGWAYHFGNPDNTYTTRNYGGHGGLMSSYVFYQGTAEAWEEPDYYTEARILPAAIGGARDNWVWLGWSNYRFKESHQITVYRNNEYGYSDDRLKTNEVFVENATDTLMKLKPQTYDKHTFVYDHLSEEEHSNVSDDGLVFSSYSNSFVQQSDFFQDASDSERPWMKRTLSDKTDKETGLIAQDIWYDAPELRHIVSLSKDANPSEEKPVGGEDPQDDPDYDQAGWGTREACVSYTQLIPLLIKSNQELHERIRVLESRIVVSNETML